MKIGTTSIIESIELFFSTSFSNINPLDYSKVDYVTLNHLDIVSNPLQVNEEELLIFKNLETLVIKNMVIGDKLASIISKLPIKYLKIYNSEFDDIDYSCFSKIEKILLNNVVDFDTSSFNKLTSIKDIILEDFELDNFNMFSNIILNTLDVHLCRINDIIGLNDLSCERLIIKEKFYNDFKSILPNTRITVMENVAPYVKLEVNYE